MPQPGAVQPAKYDPGSGVGVSAPVAPWSSVSVHFAPQSMPSTPAKPRIVSVNQNPPVSLPEPVPDLVTVSVWVMNEGGSENATNPRRPTPPDRPAYLNVCFCNGTSDLPATNTTLKLSLGAC